MASRTPPAGLFWHFKNKTNLIHKARENWQKGPKDMLVEQDLKWIFLAAKASTKGLRETNASDPLCPFSSSRRERGCRASGLEEENQEEGYSENPEMEIWNLQKRKWNVYKTHSLDENIY